jgi:hypothetical protein
LFEIKFFFFSHSSKKNVLSPHITNAAFPMGANTQDPRNPAHQLCLAQETWIKTRILKLKISLNQLWVTWVYLVHKILVCFLNIILFTKDNTILFKLLVLQRDWNLWESVLFIL